MAAKRKRTRKYPDLLQAFGMYDLLALFPKLKILVEKALSQVDYLKEIFAMYC